MGLAKRVKTAFFGPKYDPRPLERHLKRLLGEATLTDMIKPAVLTAYDIKLQKPIIFSKIKAMKEPLLNCYLKDVLRATSAAPTYFPPTNFRPVGNGVAAHQGVIRMSSRGAIVDRTESGAFVEIPAEYHVVDGGVFANNPVQIAVQHVLTNREDPQLFGDRAEFSSYQDLLVLSLGTGEDLPKYDTKAASKWGTLKWAVPVINILYSGMPNVSDMILASTFSSQDARQNYLRIQQLELPDKTDEMDNSSLENLKQLVELGKDSLGMKVRTHTPTGLLEVLPETNRQRLDQFANWLIEEKRARGSMRRSSSAP